MKTNISFISSILTTTIVILLYFFATQPLPKKIIDTKLRQLQDNSSIKQYTSSDNLHKMEPKFNRVSEKRKVILLSYSRSGSSLLGELMSIPSSSSHYFEPLRQLKLTCSQIFDNTKSEGVIRPHLTGILNCNPKVVMELAKFSVRKNAKSCESSHLRVIKTIRLRRNGVKSLLRESPKVKVVHLIRDPRLQEISRRRSNSFACEKEDHMKYCQLLSDDLLLEEDLKVDNRYYRIKYEDLTSNPIEEVKKIYDFMEEPFLERYKNEIQRHFTASEDSNNKYYGTFRVSGFNHSDFSAMSLKRKVTVETECKDFMKKVGYLV